MSKQGYFKIDRQLLQHSIWLSEPFTKGQAWIDLIGMANFSDREKIDGSNAVIVPRGSFLTSDVLLSKRWRWGRTKVRNYLLALETLKMLTTERTPRGTRITIEKYAFYQDDRTTDDIADELLTNSRRTTDEQLTNNRRTPKKNDKNIYINNNYIYEPEIEDTPTPKKARKKKEIIPPTLEEVKAYISEKGYGVNPEEFFYFYDAREWKTKNGNIGNWKSQISYWELHRKPETTAEGRKREEYNIDF